MGGGKGRKTLAHYRQMAASTYSGHLCHSNLTTVQSSPLDLPRSFMTSQTPLRAHSNGYLHGRYISVFDYN